jgi:peptidoglycan/LPS O-acetylase OafA/YrhL
MHSFASSLSVQFLSLQNVSFLSEGEYFLGSEGKPLLHTWSLAVEEQFYLFWPLTLLLTGRLAAARQPLLIGGLLVLSFLANLALMSISPKASFYLLPPRAWELGLGGLIALLERRGHLRLTAGRTTLAAAGLVGILVSIFAFSHATPFPGYAALLPVISTALIIVAGIGGPNAATGLLSHPVAIRIGLISYPIYLWHWPLLAYCRHLKIDASAPLPALTIVVATLALSEATFRLVESPIRERRWLPTSRSLLLTVGAAATLLTATAVHTTLTDGAAYRYPPAARAYLTAAMQSRSSRCGLVFRALHPRDPVCALQEQPAAEQRILLWGNSHADMWSPVLQAGAVKHGASLFLNARNCRATTDSDFCGAGLQQQILSVAKQEQMTDVVLAATWYGALGRPDDKFEAELTAVVDALVAAGLRVWLVLDTPSDSSFDPKVAFAKNPTAPQFGIKPLADYRTVQGRERALFERIAARHATGQVAIIDPAPGLCDGASCYGGTAERPWFRDTNHVTDAGAARAQPAFEALFAAPAPRPAQP